ncbi:Hypothetical predicted protein, partial [Pelobates cultripes]
HIMQGIKQAAPDTREPGSFDTLCLGRKTQAKPLSLCYQNLLGMGKTDKLSYMVHWESELNSTIESNKWSAAMALVIRATHCLDHVEAAYKLWMRWYITPRRLALIYPGSQQVCWRCCAQTGTLSHIFWHCPVLHTLW